MGGSQFLRHGDVVSRRQICVCVYQTIPHEFDLQGWLMELPARDFTEQQIGKTKWVKFGLDLFFF